MKNDRRIAVILTAGMLLPVVACNSRNTLLKVRDAAADQPAPLGGAGTGGGGSAGMAGTGGSVGTVATGGSGGFTSATGGTTTGRGGTSTAGGATASAGGSIATGGIGADAGVGGRGGADAAASGGAAGGAGGGPPTRDASVDAPVVPACGSGQQWLAVEIDGKALDPVNITGSTEAPLNSFSITGVNHAGTLETTVSVSATGLALGQQAAGDIAYLGYRVYDQKTAPYTLVEQFASQKLAGTITVSALAQKYGERNCGTFDLTATGDHVFHVRGAFDQVFPYPTPGGGGADGGAGTGGSSSATGGSTSTGGIAGGAGGRGGAGGSSSATGGTDGGSSSADAGVCGGEYTACGCGCCFGSGESLRCYYPALGETRESIIAADLAAKAATNCALVGCAFPQRYVCCVAAPPESPGSATYAATGTSTALDRIRIVKTDASGMCTILQLVDPTTSSTAFRITLPARWGIEMAFRAPCAAGSFMDNAMGGIGSASFQSIAGACVLDLHVTLFFGTTTLEAVPLDATGLTIAGIVPNCR